MVEPVKIILSFGLFVMQKFGCCFSYRVRACIGGDWRSQKFGNAAAPPLVTGAWARYTSLPHMYYRA